MIKTHLPAAELQRMAITDSTNIHLRLCAVENERDMLVLERDILVRTVANQHRQIATLMLHQDRRLTVSADEAVAAIMARADADGAMHRDAMIETLRSMGAR